MNTNDVELLTNMIRHTVGESPRIQLKEICLLQYVGGDKLLTVTLDVETLDGHRTLDVATTIDRHILRNDNRGISSYFPIVAGAVKEKVAEMYDTTIGRHLWIKRNYPTVDGALQAYSAMGGVYRTEYMGRATDADRSVIVTLDPDGGYVPVVLRAPGESIRENEMAVLARILRHIERRNKPSVS